MHPPVDRVPFDESLAVARLMLRQARKVAVLTGAGISAESGLATFRGAGGLWEGHRIEDVATPSAFQLNPALVWRFYNLRRASLATVAPNPGHHALAELEKRLGAAFTLVTQNVDGLHQAAGNRNVLEIHGALRRVRCSGCQRVDDRGTEALPELPRCHECADLLRPDIVWFGETLPAKIWNRAIEAVQTCDCFLVIGTSATVYPASGLINIARKKVVDVIEINVVPSAASALADVVLIGPAGTTLPRLIAEFPNPLDNGTES